MKQEQLPSIKRERSSTDHAGISLVEVILASAIFSLFVTAFVGAYLYGEQSTMLAGGRARAALLAEEGLEAIRNMRDASFANLTNGTFGLTTTGNQWNLSGSSDLTDIFTRQINIASVDVNRKLVTSSVTWSQNRQRSGSVSVSSYFTNWQASGVRSGMLVYGNGGVTTDSIMYQIYNADGTWTAAAAAADINGSSTNRVLRAGRVYASATRNEKILLSRHYNGTTQYIYGQVWNGTSWGNVQLFSNWNAATFLDAQNFDGTYLANGDFMVVYSDNTNIPKMRVWNGSTWGAQVATQNLGGVPIYIVTKVRPNSNEVMLAAFDQTNDTNSEYYNGAGYNTSNWVAVTSHANNAPSATGRMIDFVWSANDLARGMLVYTSTNSDKTINGRIWTVSGGGGGTWGAVVDSAASASNLGALAITARPGANEFSACTKDLNATPRILCYRATHVGSVITWSAPSNNTLVTGSDTGIQRSYHLGFEASSGNPAIAVYSDATNVPKLKKYNATGNAWDGAPTSIATAPYTPIGVIKTVRIIPSLTDDSMLLVTDANLDLYSVLWDGSLDAVYTSPAGKAFFRHGFNGSAAADLWYDFAWDIY